MIIAGGTAVGKSTLMQFFAKALADAGFSFELSAPKFDGNPIVCDEFQMDRLGAIKGKRKTKILLEERRTYTSIDTTGQREKIYGVKEGT